MIRKGLIWFRADLRLDDNPALIAALGACEEVLAVYFFSDYQWEAHNESNIKHEFLINNPDFFLQRKYLAYLEQDDVQVNLKH